MTAVFGFQALCGVGLLAGHFRVLICASMASRSSSDSVCFYHRSLNSDHCEDNIHPKKLAPSMDVFLRGILQTKLAISIDGDSGDELKREPRLCVFTNWLKADLHCFPCALIG